MPERFLISFSLLAIVCAGALAALPKKSADWHQLAQRLADESQRSAALKEYAQIPDLGTRLKNEVGGAHQVTALRLAHALDKADVVPQVISQMDPKTPWQVCGLTYALILKIPNMLGRKADYLKKAKQVISEISPSDTTTSTLSLVLLDQIFEAQMVLPTSQIARYLNSTSYQVRLRVMEFAGRQLLSQPAEISKLLESASSMKPRQLRVRATELLNRISR